MTLREHRGVESFLEEVVLEERGGESKSRRRQTKLMQGVTVVGGWPEQKKEQRQRPGGREGHAMA